MTAQLAEIDALLEKVAKLDGILARASELAVEPITAIVQLQFDEGRDPYGNAWADLAESTKRRGRTPPPLTDTRAMRDDISIRPLNGEDTGLTLDAFAPYASFHQDGAPNANVPVRKMFPDEGVSPTWNAALQESTDRAIREFFK
jgi:hypothetical protein